MNQESENNSDKQALKSTPKRQWWRKLVLTTALLLLGSAGGGLIYGWYFVRQKLIPLIETETTEYLHRPLKLGKLKSISLGGASFARSALPATKDNPDFVKTEAVKVRFALLHFLRRRELKLAITLVEPDVYIEQDETKLWTPTDFGSESESSGGIEVNVRSIALDGGQLSLVAYNAEKAALNPAVIAELDLVTVRPQDDGIEFEAVAELMQGGKFTVDGESKSDGTIDLDVIARQLKASEVSNLLALPIELTQGDLDGKLNVVLGDKPIPELDGALNLDRVSLQIPNLVKPFSNSEGTVRFEGTKIELDDITTNFGQVVGKAKGTLDLEGAGDYQIDTEVEPVAAEKIIDALELDAPVPVKGKIAGLASVRGSLEDTRVKFNLATVSPSSIDRVPFRKVEADLELIGTTLNVRRFTGRLRSWGRIEGNGILQLDDLQDMAFNVTAKDVSAKAIARNYNNKLPVDLGRVTGQTNITARAGDPASLKVRGGGANFALGNGIVRLNELDYSNGQWSSQLTARGVEFGSLPFGEGSAETIARGKIDGTFEVAGTSDFADLSRVTASGTGELNTVGGRIDLPQIAIANGGWKTDAKMQDLKLQRLFPDLPDEFNDNLSGEFYLTGNIPDDESPQTLINGFGDLALARGRVKVEDLKIVDGNWTAIARGKNLKLKQLSSSTPDQFGGLVNGRLKLSGTTDNITPEGIVADGGGSLTLPEGVFKAQTLAIAEGKFNALVIPQGVDLSLFADPDSDELDLKGKLGGQLTVTGRVDNLSPTAVSAKGNLSFSEGIDLLEQSLGAAIVWDGSRLDVLKAIGDGLNAKGHVVLDSSFFEDIPDKLAAVDYFEFAVSQARGIDIRKLRLTLPTWAENLAYSGRGEFAGKISGVPSAITIGGNLGIRNFRVEDIDFAPFLAGNVQISPKSGVKLSLQEIITDPLNPIADGRITTRPLDKIELSLDSQFSPLTIAIVRDYIAVKGTGQAEVLNLTTTNVPLEFLKIVALKSDDIEVPDNFALQPIDGELSGDFVFNLKTLAASGQDVVVDNPALASIRGDRLEGDFQYADGFFAIQDVEFKQKNSIYKLEGNLSRKPDDIDLDGRISINDGQIQDILVALQIFELTDFAKIFSDRAYGNAKDLYLPPAPSKRAPIFDVGYKDAPIIEQLQLLAAIQAWLGSLQQERQAALVPDIEKLTGTFDGQIDVFGSLQQGLISKFDFLGKDWRWGDLVGQKVIAKGSLREGILTFLPISVELQDIDRESADAGGDISPTLLFTGTFGGATQSGQFRLVEVPLKLVKQLVSFPQEFALDGLINATASIAGTQENPQSRGEIRIDDASLNETSIQSTKGSFSYNRSRLEFSASSTIAENVDPVILKGGVPYKLPFAKINPESDRLQLQLNVKDKGLALLDIFSRGELKWIEGEGEIALDISGILDSPQKLPRKLSTQGIAKIENATIAAKSLPKNPITNINSRVFFDLDNIRVNSFQGDFGGGTITAAGTVPLRDSTALNPLTINFKQIKKVELPKLYSGSVGGTLKILGKATEPNITGNLTLYNGTILLASETDPVAEERNPDSELPDDSRTIAAATQYKDLKLKLGNDIQISQPPIFTFLSTGDLMINGTFLQPSPNGTIVLKRGQVNLFTTQLGLSRDYQNTARFSSNNVLDPFLDVLLVGSAIETTNRSIPSEVSPTEIPDSGLQTLETIRISAKVKGLASQITNKIELTSSPSRTPAEIAALLGGGFVEALANSNGTSGLATLAGSALFGSLNAEFNDAFPIGELRLFPTPIIDDNRDNETDGIAGEIAFELVNNLSFSVLKIFNNDNPAQFGFRYRWNDNFVLRGSSNFRDNGTRALIEYELRF